MCKRAPLWCWPATWCRALQAASVLRDSATRPCASRPGLTRRSGPCGCGSRACRTFETAWCCGTGSARRPCPRLRGCSQPGRGFATAAAAARRLRSCQAAELAPQATASSSCRCVPQQLSRRAAAARCRRTSDGEVLLAVLVHQEHLEHLARAHARLDLRGAAARVALARLLRLLRMLRRGRRRCCRRAAMMVVASWAGGQAACARPGPHLIVRDERGVLHSRRLHGRCRRCCVVELGGLARRRCCCWPQARVRMRLAGGGAPAISRGAAASAAAAFGGADAAAAAAALSCSCCCCKSQH